MQLMNSTKMANNQRIQIKRGMPRVELERANIDLTSYAKHQIAEEMAQHLMEHYCTIWPSYYYDGIELNIDVFVFSEEELQQFCYALRREWEEKREVCFI